MTTNPRQWIWISKFHDNDHTNKPTYKDIVEILSKESSLVADKEFIDSLRVKQDCHHVEAFASTHNKIVIDKMYPIDKIFWGEL